MNNKQLWAPWRARYVQRDSEEHVAQECFLCDAGQRDQQDEAVLVVAVSEHAVVLLNRYPYSGGHLLVAPRRHAAHISELTHQEYTDVMDSVRKAVSAIETLLHPHGCNIGINLGAASGAGVPGHLHVHIVPRWEGDTNFMTVTADTRVISGDLSETWRRVTDHYVTRIDT
jgi:ATP adenylyltransferase